MIVASLVAFVLINNLEYCKAEFSASSSYTLEHDSTGDAETSQKRGWTNNDRSSVEKYRSLSESSKREDNDKSNKQTGALKQNGISNPALDVSQQNLDSSYNAQSGISNSHQSLDASEQGLGSSHCARADDVNSKSSVSTLPSDGEGRSVNGSAKRTGDNEGASLMHENAAQVSTAVIVLLLAQVVLINFFIVSFLLSIQVTF
jgi:hypothetical protein